MIFPHDQAGYLARGHRTTIRVPVDRRLTAAPLRSTRPGESRPFVPAPGELLPIQQHVTRPATSGPDKDGWETVCHVQIVEVARGPLGRLTDDQAVAEGFPTAQDFEIAWSRRYSSDWFNRQVRNLIDEGTHVDDAEETVGYMAVNRFEDRWATREVWVLTVEAEHDIDRHLERAATAKSEHGYTIGTDQITAGTVPPVDRLAQKWPRRAARRHLEAISENATPQERSRRARALGRRVRELALHDPVLTRKIEDLVRQAEQEAA